MSGSGYSTPTSGFQKLPPIVTSESDRQFLLLLNEYIEMEMGNVDQTDDEQRYIIYKTAFNQIIEHVTAYQPILTTIKKEYEETIEAIKKAQREANFLHSKLKAMASEPSTIRNYRKRGDELEERVNIVRKDNERLHSQLMELKVRRMEREKQEKETTEPPKRELKKDHRLIPGLTLEECTNKELLQRKLADIDRQLKELTISFKTRYVPKTRKLELKDNLDNKVAYRDMLLRQGHFYKAKRQRLKVALEAAQAYNREKPPHQTVGDTVMMALQYAAMLARKQRENAEQGGTEGQSQSDGAVREGSATGEGGQAGTSSFEDDDPNKEKEAEMMLEYIEKFNELFEDGKYEEAAIHAANSPKGILRTSATLAKFRDVKIRVNNRTPLLMFCDALMSSAGTENARPDAKLSLECVECALYENRLDLLSHWISQNRLTFSAEIGQTIADHCKCEIPCRCTGQAMAQNIYMKLKVYKEAVHCLLKQGRVKAGLELAQYRCPFSREDHIQVLKKCPSIALVNALAMGWDGRERPLPVGLVVMTLVQEDKFSLALPFIQELQNTPSLEKQGVFQLVEETQLRGKPAVAHHCPMTYHEFGGLKTKTMLFFGRTVPTDEPKTSSFHSAILDDHETSMDTWNEIINLLQDQGYDETVMNLLAAITVMAAMKGAMRTSQEFAESDQQEGGED